MWVHVHAYTCMVYQKFTSTEYYNEHVVAYWTTIVFSSYGL